MSRHRNVRAMNYDEEYDDYYEEMPSSYEEHEFGVSPTTAKQYLYNPNDAQLDQRIRTFSISEENEEDILKESQTDPVSSQKLGEFCLFSFFFELFFISS